MNLRAGRPATEAVRWPLLPVLRQGNRLIPRPARRSHVAMACLIAGAGVLLAPVLPARCAYGMEFAQTQVSATEAVVSGRGRIIPGDAERLHSALPAVAPALHLI